MEGKDVTQFALQMTQPAAESRKTPTSDSELEDSRGGSWTAMRIFLTAVNAINHTLIILVTVFLAYHFTKEESLKEYSIASLHAVLCSIAYVLLLSEGILALAGENIPTKFLSRRANSHVHWVLHVIATILNLVGVIIMCRAKSKHFLSIHGITGIASTIVMCLLLVFGYPVLVAAKLRRFVRPVVVKFLHNFLGIGCFVVGMASQCYAYKKRWFVTVTGNIEGIDTVAIVLTALITVFSLRGALQSLFRQALGLFR